MAEEPEELIQKLSALLSSNEWSEAATLAREIGVPPAYVAKHHFLGLESFEGELPFQLLTTISSDDPAWVVKAAYEMSKQVQESAVLLPVIGLAKSCALQVFQNAEDDQVQEERDNDSSSDIQQAYKALQEIEIKTLTWAEFEMKVKEQEQIAQPEQDEDVPQSSLSLQAFIDQPLLESVIFLASMAQTQKLKTIIKRQSPILWPYRFAIIEAIPSWIEATNLLGILPALGPDDWEMKWSWEPFEQVQVDFFEESETSPIYQPQNEPYSADKLQAYYFDKVQSLASTGLVAESLSLVQIAASLGIGGIEELGEELSLFSKLVYDRPVPISVFVSTGTSKQTAPSVWTLNAWNSSEPSEIIKEYLAYSTEETITSDIERLVLPYLAVLEARLEREGEADTDITRKLLNNYLLSSVVQQDTTKLLRIIEHSKPTIPRSKRIIKDDKDLAKITLASVYSSDRTDGDTLVDFGHLFECLPVFEVSESPEQEPAHSIFDFVPSSRTPGLIFDALAPFSEFDLSRALDALDVHLTSAETFSRYSSPVKMCWFLTTYGDLAVQTQQATRISRTAFRGTAVNGNDEGEFESDDEWVELLEDLLALREGGDEPREARRPFSMITRTSITKIFFSGLLSAERFELAKTMFESGENQLDGEAQETLVIEASREFYDNAESGNLHKGNMKLAMECLCVLPETVRIKQEKEFIEATSRLCSFKIYSQSGVPVTPIEIRLSKDRLSFVFKLLASNDDSYKHPDVILQLVEKLGYKDDLIARVRALAMICDAALFAGDYERSAKTCEKMVDIVDSNSAIESTDVLSTVWKTCFILGKHEDFKDLGRRMELLGRALTLCPSENIVELLSAWSNVEKHAYHQQEQSQTGRAPSSLANETAAAAMRTINQTTAAIFGSKHVEETGPKDMTKLFELGENSITGMGIREGLSNRFTAGVGWLIGADA